MAEIEVKVPDIGDFKNVTVIELLVQPGARVAAEQSLITVESDKASMEIPSPLAGTVKALKIQLGDKVNEGSPLLILETDAATAPAPSPAAPSPQTPSPPTPLPITGEGRDATAFLSPVIGGESPKGERGAPSGAAAIGGTAPNPARLPHASPAVRRFARELGVPLERVSGSAAHGRITEEDVRAFVKSTLAKGVEAPTPSGGTGLNLLPWPQIDFAQFGAIESKPLSRIQKLSSANLARNWVMVPAVTYHDQADITDLEALRNQLNRESEKSGGTKVTMLAFLIKAVVCALQRFPNFNASLSGEQLVLKKYFHIGFAADTPNGLVVPVLRDANRKGILTIAEETAALAAKARAGKLSPSEMQGGCFTISSLGGIGGTYFSPIVNAPEVAILGVNKAAMQPVWDGKAFAPRLLLPLSLSADHRVIDGALATRFNNLLLQLLSDFRRVAL